jgi:hypothetical protein
VRRLVWSSSERHAEAWPRAAAGSQLSTTECSCGAETRRAHTDRHAPPATCCLRPSKMPGARRETWKERRSCSGRHAAAAADAAWFIAGCGCRDAPPARTAPPSARSQSAREPIPDTSVTATSRPKQKKNTMVVQVSRTVLSPRAGLQLPNALVWHVRILFACSLTRYAPPSSPATTSAAAVHGVRFSNPQAQSI